MIKAEWTSNDALSAEQTTQTNAPNALSVMDCVSRQAAIDAADEIIARDNSGNNDVVKAMTAWKEYIRGLQSVQPEPRWIPVEIKPPKEKKTYWVCTDTGYQCECRWTNNRFGMIESDEWGWSIFDTPQYTKVVAWRELPEPYREEADNAQLD